MSRYNFDADTTNILYLDADHKKIGGVCAGIADHFDTKRLYVRIGAVIILCIMPLAAIAGYGLAYLILDEDLEDAHSEETEPKQVAPEESEPEETESKQVEPEQPRTENNDSELNNSETSDSETRT